MNSFFSPPCLIVVDIQDSLLKVMSRSESLLERCSSLLRGAVFFNMPLCFFQQNPKGLGPVNKQLRSYAPDAPVFDKQSFSGHQKEDFRRWLKDLDSKEIVICGIETHVCVAQTAIGLARDGFRVHLLYDAVDSRREEDKKAALKRMAAFGILPLSVEALLFELMERADLPSFRDFLSIVK